MLTLTLESDRKRLYAASIRHWRQLVLSQLHSYSNLDSHALAERLTKYKNKKVSDCMESEELYNSGIVFVSATKRYKPSAFLSIALKKVHSYITKL